MAERIRLQRSDFQTNLGVLKDQIDVRWVIRVGTIPVAARTRMAGNAYDATRRRAARVDLYACTRNSDFSVDQKAIYLHCGMNDGVPKTGVENCSPPDFAYGTAVALLAMKDRIIVASDSKEVTGAENQIQINTIRKIVELPSENYFVCIGLPGVPGFDARQHVKDTFTTGMELCDLANKFAETAGPAWLSGIEKTAKANVTPPNRLLEVCFLGRGRSRLELYIRRFEAVDENGKWSLKSDGNNWDGESPSAIFPGFRKQGVQELYEKIEGNLLGKLDYALVEAVAVECEAGLPSIGWPIDLLQLTLHSSRFDRYIRGTEGKPMLS